MRSFKDILTESKKTYTFKIGVAGELPEDFATHMETALKKFNLLKVSAGKKTPIQERPLDFPNLNNSEVTYFEAEVGYPTTSQVLREYLGTICTVPQSHIIVRNPNEPLEELQAENEDTVYQPMLATEDMGGESAQKSVGNNRVMDLLKELEVARKERDADPIAGVPAGSK